MGRISAQVSVYPLRRESIGPVIRKAVRCLRQHTRDVRVGEMSTTVWVMSRRCSMPCVQPFVLPRRTATLSCVSPCLIRAPNRVARPNDDGEVDR